MSPGNAALGSVGTPADRDHRFNGSNGTSVSYPRSSKTYGPTGNSDEYGINRDTLSSSPERIRLLENNSSLDVVPEDGIVMDFSPSVENRIPRYTAGAPLVDDEEEEEWELDEELEEQGLYRGSYRRLVLLYTLTPITFLVAFSLLAALPYVLYPMTQDWPYPSVPYFPHPFPELLTSAALFSLSHLTRDPMISLIISMFPSPSAVVPTVLATAIHTLIYLLLQQSALALLLVAQHMHERPTTRDAAFLRVWWLALGWAAAEAVIGTCQGYQARAAYRDVLVTVRRSAETPTKFDCGVETDGMGLGPMSPLGSGSRSPSSKPAGTRTQSTLELFERQVEDDVYDRSRGGQPFRDLEEAEGERQPLLPPREARNSQDQAIKMLVEDELEELLAIRAREELEDAYGVPVIRIPVFISCLQRINALLLILGVSLLLAQGYLRSTFARDGASPNHALAITAPVVWVVQCYLALLHTPLVLPRMGVPAVVYSGSLVSLGAFFAGLAMWEGLS
ncbi:hypothetical protein H0H87_007389 [Tephrocybe sp. NHM501043]|nr:hypothetical protein H0H87_007389 [Tephrocybe sp. NHM501043]